MYDCAKEVERKFAEKKSKVRDKPREDDAARGDARRCALGKCSRGSGS